jgi:hypothetical protein
MVINDPTFVRVSLQKEGIATKVVELQEGLTYLGVHE